MEQSSNEEILQQLHQNPDEDTRRDLMERLYTQNIRLIQKFAQPYINAGMEAEDALQEGYIALCEAVARYDPTGGASFSTYFVQWIRAIVGRAAQNTGSHNHIPVKAQKLLFQYKRAVEVFQKTTGRNPTDRYLKRKLNVSDKALSNIKATYHAYITKSLSAPIVDTEGSLLCGDTVADLEDPISTICDRISAQQDAVKLWAEVDNLEESQAEVIRMRYGGEGKTLTATSERLGIGRSQVQTAEFKAIRNLRRNKVIRQMAEDRRYLTYAYRGSFERFRTSGASITEWIVLKRLDWRNEDDD